MTISTTTNVAIGLGTGSATSFNYNFLINDATTIVVTYTDASGNATTVPSSQYSVSGIGNVTGGTITYPLTGSPIAAGTTLTIQRVLPFAQLTSIEDQGAFYPAAVEDGLDQLEMQIQQNAGDVSRALRAPPGDGALNMVLPTALARAGMYLGFGSDGRPTAVPASNTLPVDLSAFTAKSSGASSSRTLAKHFADALTPQDFGAVGNGVADDTTPVQNAINAQFTAGGGIVRFPVGTYLLSDKLTCKTGVYLLGSGIGASIITQGATNKPCFDFSDSSNCGARGFTLHGGPSSVATGTVYALATTSDVDELLLEDIYVADMGNNGIGFDLQSGATKIVYFAMLKNCTAKGGSTGDYQNKIGFRFGTVGNQPVVRPQLYGGRAWRTDYGAAMNNVAGLEWYGIRMDDVNGANGIGLSFGTATDCHVYGFQGESGTFKKYVSFGALSNACAVWMDAIEPTPSQLVDSGSHNSIYGQTGSGGVINYVGQSTNFNANVQILGSGEFVQYKRFYDSYSIGTVSASSSSAATAILGSRISKTVSADFRYWGRELTTNASWELRGRVIADWDGAGGLLTYGSNEDSENASVGLNNWGSYSIATVTASANANAVRLMLNNTGTHDLHGIRLDVLSIETDSP